MVSLPKNPTDPPPSVPPTDVPSNAPTACPGTSSSTAGKASACVGCPNQTACSSGVSASPDVPTDASLIAHRLRHAVRHKLLILSGKGGVGKSTVAAQLSLCLSRNASLDVGLLDVDVCGPSAPHMLGVSGEEVRMSNNGWSPVFVDDNLSVMSIGFMLPDKDDAVVWRGVRKTGLIKQFLKDVDWGDLDYLVVDAPPGTSDEHISLVQLLKDSDVDGAIIVTTPQEVSLLDVRKEISFCRKSGTPIIGVIENMSGFVCQHCQGCSDIFYPSSGGAEKMCRDLNIPFLGKIPLDPKISKAGELGRSAFEGDRTAGVEALEDVVTKIRTLVEKDNVKATEESDGKA